MSAKRASIDIEVLLSVTVGRATDASRQVPERNGVAWLGQVAPGLTRQGYLGSGRCARGGSTDPAQPPISSRIFSSRRTVNRMPSGSECTLPSYSTPTQPRYPASTTIFIIRRKSISASSPSASNTWLLALTARAIGIISSTPRYLSYCSVDDTVKLPKSGSVPSSG